MPRAKRFVAVAALTAVTLLGSACTGGPTDDGPPPTQSPSPSSSLPIPAAGELLAEHDGYVAVTGNCAQLDWTPLQTLGLFEPDPPGGFFLQQGSWPQANCAGSFPAGDDPDSIQVDGSATVRLLLHHDEQSAGNCGGSTPDQAKDDDPVWDDIEGTVEVDDNGALVMYNLRSGVLCVNLSLTLHPVLVEKLADPDADLKSLALTFATNARETALWENFPDLPAPSAS